MNAPGKKTRSQVVDEDVSALLRARCTLLWIVSREEVRVERALVDAAAKAGYETAFWDCATGHTDSKGEVVDANLKDPQAMLDAIGKARDRKVYVMRDLHKWFDPMVLRGVRSLARSLTAVQNKSEARAVVVLSPSGDVPIELSGSAIVIEYPLPERSEIEGLLNDVVSVLPPEVASKAIAEGGRDAAIDAAVGLSADEASACYAKSLVTTKRIDPKVVGAEKKRVIARERVLTWHDPDPRGLDAVGGLELLKGWLSVRKSALSKEAREFGLPAPKGVLLVGVPGCGKSLTAKAVASAWALPLLRLDMGALKSKFVGESEGNIRKALGVAEAVAPCVLWLDEIEKALAGATGPQGDGGVSSDALGAILSWMQERSGAVFVVATANDVGGLPPELLRKGRFDEMFFVDLPTDVERAEVLKATLRQYDRGEAAVDVAAVVEKTRGWTGAEISALVPEAMFAGFADGARQLSTDDLLAAARNVVPLSQTAADKIGKLREWAKGRTRPASAAEKTASGTSRTLDL